MSKEPNKEAKFPWILLVSIAVALLFTCLYRSGGLTVLEPGGRIASLQKDLMITTTGLMMIVVIPVLIMTVFISWKYRFGNKKADYKPDWSHSTFAESIWWGLPCLIILALSVLTWIGTHDMDPFKPLEDKKKPLTIQVVSLQWKWLFLYPEYGIACVNELHFPENTPIRFVITSDAPMNSFWIPKMGSQIYAMPGMRTEVNLIADEKGNFRGSSANLSGEGFSKMVFTAVSESDADFQSWVEATKHSPNALTLDTYKKLAEPGESPVIPYTLEKDDLYDWIIMKYMMPH